MSTRTIIEINHDHINNLRGRDHFLWNRLLLDLSSCDLNADERAFLSSRGISVLGQRHHSEPEWRQEQPAHAVSVDKPAGSSQEQSGGKP